MRVFAVEAYGGKHMTDGSIAHFTVRADSATEAIEIVRSSSMGQRYGRFEVVEETGQARTGESRIIGQGEGPFVKGRDRST